MYGLVRGEQTSEIKVSISKKSLVTADGSRERVYSRVAGQKAREIYYSRQREDAVVFSQSKVEMNPKRPFNFQFNLTQGRIRRSTMSLMHKDCVGPVWTRKQTWMQGKSSKLLKSLFCTRGVNLK